MVEKIIRHRKYNYIDVGQGEPLVLIHGLMGSLSNFTSTIDYFKQHMRVIVPILPIYELDLFHVNVHGLQKFIQRFLKKFSIQNPILVGNSLGGHLSLLQVLQHPQSVRSLVLTGSSGLFENGLGATYPKRNNYEYIRMKAQSTFYDPKIATKELVDDIYETVSNRMKAIKILTLAKSAIRNYLGEELKNIKTPTLLIWGKNDIVTPPFVAEEFNNLLPKSELVFIDKCGHAPMMEVPDKFNLILHEYLYKNKIISVPPSSEK